MSSICCCEDDCRDGAERTCGDAGRAAALPALATIVFDAELDPREEIGTFLRFGGSREQGLTEPSLDRGHAITPAIGSGSASKPESSGSSNFRSSDSSPRLRWVFTELREIPSVFAMSSMPSSS